MVRKLKRLLYRWLGQERYLRMLGSLFPIGYRLGLLRRDPIYHFHYYVRHLIKPGSTVVDIGANMGYYTRIFAELVGPSGRVIAFEPVPPFYRMMQRVAAHYPQVVAHHCALGEEEKTIILSVPNEHGYLRTGLASIGDASQDSGSAFRFEARMVKGSSLLEKEARIDYIKCDIEGYETTVIPELASVIEKHRPMLQIETYGEQKEAIMALMQAWGYERYSLHGNRLVKDLPMELHFGDFLFIHPSSVKPLS